MTNLVYPENSSIKLNNKRYEEIKEIIVSTYEKYGINKIPIDGFKLASKMGIKVIPYSRLNHRTRILLLKQSEDGFCVLTKAGEWRIYYNDSIDSRRINNTILHELGHILLDHSEDSDLAEKEVKFFAKYALVPPVIVQMLGLKSSKEIWAKFNVSLEAASNAWIYYNKWLNRKAHLSKYEIRLLTLFSNSFLEVV